MADQHEGPDIDPDQLAAVVAGLAESWTPLDPVKAIVTEELKRLLGIIANAQWMGMVDDPDESLQILLAMTYSRGLLAGITYCEETNHG